MSSYIARKKLLNRTLLSLEDIAGTLLGILSENFLFHENYETLDKFLQNKKFGYSLLLAFVFIICPSKNTWSGKALTQRLF